MACEGWAGTWAGIDAPRRGDFLPPAVVPEFLLPPRRTALEARRNPVKPDMSVSNSARPPPPPISVNVRRKPPLIARRYMYPAVAATPPAPYIEARSGGEFQSPPPRGSEGQVDLGFHAERLKPPNEPELQTLHNASFMLRTAVGCNRPPFLFNEELYSEFRLILLVESTAQFST